jgi:histidinol-phosphate aminotransferase
LKQVEVCPHGSPDYRELAALGFDPAQVLDFSANLNPFGPSPRVVEALQGLPLHRYPDSECWELRERIAAYHGLAPESILVGNGSSELIWLVALALLGRDASVLMLCPTFGEYGVAARLMEAHIADFPLSDVTGFAVDIPGLARAIQKIRPVAAFLCNPNNPTGGYLSRQEVASLLEAGPETLFVLDEAYVDCAERPWSSADLLKEYRNLLVLRSLTKLHGLAGLRVGYALSGREITFALRKTKPRWSVSIVALQAALAAIEDCAHLDRSLVRLREGRAFLEAEFADLGYRVIPSATTFFLTEVGNAAQFRHALLRRGLLVRDCSSFGLPRYVRISARGLADCQRLAEAAREVREAQP